MISLNTAFKKVYGEALAQYGFQKIKGKQPYLVKVINKEIVHVVGIQNDYSMRQGFERFEIYYGAATIYRANLDLTRSIRDSKDWLRCLGYVYCGISKENMDKTLLDQFYSFYYSKDDNSLEKELILSLELFIRHILPIINNITSIKKCVNYLGIVNPMSLHLQDKEWEETNRNLNCRDGLVNILVYDSQEYQCVKYGNINKELSFMYEDMLAGKNEFTEDSFSAYKEEVLENVRKNIEFYDSVVNDVNKCKCARKVMEQRKIKNLNMLIKRGISV